MIHTILRTLCCLACGLWIANGLHAQNGAGVNKQGTYKKLPLDACYRSYYEAPEKLDTLTKPESMVAHRVWRIVDLRSTINEMALKTTYKNCEYTDLFEIIKYGLKSGRLNAFSSGNFSNPAKNKIEYKDLMAKIALHDTVSETVYDSDGNPTTGTQIRDRELNSSDLAGYVICEDWYVDEHWARREKRLVYICPVLFDEKQQKERPLFYLYYNECRDLFSSFRAYNIRDVKVGMTYDQVFLKSRFESTVIKNSNVFDRRLSEYTHGKSIDDESAKNVRAMLNEESDMFDH